MRVGSMKTCLIDAVPRRVHKLGAAVQVVQLSALLRKLLHTDILMSEGKRVLSQCDARFERCSGPSTIPRNPELDTSSA